MPTILAIETSTDACSVALLHRGGIQESFVLRPREHNQILLPQIDELLKGFSLRVADLDAIAFGAGPGSFTGLRLSAGVVQGLAFAVNKPVIPVSSLATLAHSAAVQRDPTVASTWRVALDARMNDVYYGVYGYAEGVLTNLGVDTLMPASELLTEAVLRVEGEKVGDGWRVASGEMAGMTDIYPHARSVLVLAQVYYDKGAVLPAEQALPVYLRENISWQKWRSKRESFHRV